METQKRSTRAMMRSLFVYLIGMVILAAGIMLNAKTTLGVSPVTSVSYTISLILGIPLARVILVYYLVLIGIQFLLQGKEFPKIQWLQILVSLAMSWFISLFDNLIPVAETWVGRIIMLVLAVVLTAIGASLTVRMNMLPNPADGLADVVGQKLNRGFGTGKNVLDIICIVISCILGFIFLGNPGGVGIGTVVAMIFVGRIAAKIAPINDWLYAWAVEEERLVRQIQ